MAWIGAGKRDKRWYLIPQSGALPIMGLSSFPLKVGRDLGCDVRVDEPTLSREHILIDVAGRDLIVTDLGSSNGMAVDQQRVQRAAVERRKGARVTAGGSFTFFLRYGTAEEAEACKRANLSEVKRPWLVLRGETEAGPFSDDELQDAARAGQIDPLDLVWHTPTDSRVLAGEIEGIELFPAGTSAAGASPTPPPLPEFGTPLPAAPGRPRRDTGALTCPYCWCRFDLRDLLYIAEAPQLRGDPVLGPDEATRFTPTQFDPRTNHALDAYGWPAAQLACPECHLRLPAQIRQAQVHILSVVGAPMSGKSYFLACASHWLKHHLAAWFGYDLEDVDATTNRWLNEFERLLFHQPDPTLPQQIDKTDLRGDHYRTVSLNGAEMSLPLPCVFSLTRATLPQSPPAAASEDALLVLYDNAGEHFLPGADVLHEPGTQHLVRAEGIVFLLDPVLDVGLRQAVAAASFELGRNLPAYPQEVLLNEVISRIRKHLGVSASARYDKPLLLCLSKCDLLGAQVAMGESPLVTDPESGLAALDLDRVVLASFQVRNLLLRYAPRLVRSLDAFAEHVLYVPMTALGHCPSQAGATTPAGRPRLDSYAAVRPCDICSAWVEVPLLYLLARLGYIATARREQGHIPVAGAYCVVGPNLRLRLPGVTAEVDVPALYGGYALPAPEGETWFRVPTLAGVEPI